MEQMTIGFDSYEHSTTFLKTRGQLYYEKNKEQVLDYQRTRDRDRRRKREKNYREKDRRRARARLIVFKAIKSGTLKKVHVKTVILSMFRPTMMITTSP